MIKAEVVADSISHPQKRITSLKVTMPRIILAEFNTHRMLSRNSASSRAIAFDKMVKSVEENPFIPMAWQKDHKGMQGTEYFLLGDKFQIAIDKKIDALNELNKTWLEARDEAVKKACWLNHIKSTKQISNRLLEPFMYHTVLVTATEWENFFALRCPKYQWEEHIFRSKKDLIGWIAGDDYTLKAEMEGYSKIQWLELNKGQAEIHMMAVAEAIWDAINESEPKVLLEGEWHIPFLKANELRIWTYLYGKLGEGIPQKEYAKEYWEVALKIATARCARISYTVIGDDDKVPEASKDIELHDKLAESGHWSPFEHCAQAGRHYGWVGNFYGWKQYRKQFKNENIEK